MRSEGGAEDRKEHGTVPGWGVDLERILNLPWQAFSLGRSLDAILDELAAALIGEFGFDSVEIHYCHRYTRQLTRVAASPREGLSWEPGRLDQILVAGGQVCEPVPGGYLFTFPVAPPTTIAEKRGGPVGQGILAVKARTFSPAEEGLLRFLAAQIGLIAERYEYLRYTANLDICLREVQEMTVSLRTTVDVGELSENLGGAKLVKRLFDHVGLWLYDEHQHLQRSVVPVQIEEFPIEAQVDRNIPRQIEQYDIPLAGLHSVILCPLLKEEIFFGYLGFFKSRQRLLRPEEKAAAVLVAQQATYILENILLHKNLEEQNARLREQKEFSDAIFTSINSGILVVDEADRVLSANPSAAKILNLAGDGKSDEGLNQLAADLVAAATVGQSEGLFTGPNGAKLCLGFTQSELQGETGPAGKIIQFRDIGEIVGLRKQLRRKEYFSTIGEMASWIAHEVRNPLFAIASVAKILQQQISDEGQGRFIGSILQETARLELLIDDLLMFGKPLNLRVEEVSLARFLSTVVDGMKPQIEEAGCWVEIVAEQPEIHVEIDRDRMQQVFYNLIKNAVEAGADLIRIAIEIADDMVTLTCTNNGKGIKPADLPKMFTPFFTTKKDGTGLGLPICRKIVEEHGASIAIESLPGDRTRVRIDLPGRLLNATVDA